MNRRDAIGKVALLFGATFSAPTLLAMQKAQNSSTNIGAKINFNNEEIAIITAISEIIIPKTDTPGATDAKVSPFIQMMLIECYKPLEQNNFKSGIASLQAKSFLTMSDADKTSVLEKLETATKIEMEKRNVKTVKIGDNVDKETMDIASSGVPFWRLIKELTLLGYYTSEVGANASFIYEPIPGKYVATKIVPGQKAYMYL